MPCKEFYCTAFFYAEDKRRISHQRQRGEASSQHDTGDCHQQEFTSVPICFGELFCGEYLEKNSAAEADCSQSLMNEMEDIIYTCCRIKSEIVKRDERDTGDRMLLNFGHTIGHAIETYHGYEKFSHGEAVAAGMHMMTIKTEEEGLTQKGTSERIRKLLNKYSLPLNAEAADKNELLGSIALDKKSDGDELNIVVLSEIGNAFLKKIKKEEILRYL